MLLRCTEIVYFLALAITNSSQCISDEASLACTIVLKD